VIRVDDGHQGSAVERLSGQGKATGWKLLHLRCARVVGGVPQIEVGAIAVAIAVAIAIAQPRVLVLASGGVVEQLSL
jgi:hypothetical protein